MAVSARELVGYEALRGRGVFYPQPSAGYLLIEGPDRLDFIQRQTTNDVRLVGLDRAVLTVLTSPAARILDVFTVLQDGESLALLTQPGRGEPAAEYLRRRVFFMDHVLITDASARYTQFDLDGAAAACALTDLGLVPIPELDRVVDGEVGGLPVKVVGQEGLSGLGYRLIGQAGDSGALAAALEGVGLVRLPEETYAVLRVEAGRPAFGRELTEAYTPLEANLHRAVSTSKGCYTGQEVIARQITYDKVAQRLVGLRLEAPVSEGSEVLGGERRVGRVTSAIESPRLGPIALAYVRRPYYEPGTRVSAADDGREVAATVAALPLVVE